MCSLLFFGSHLLWAELCPLKRRHSPNTQDPGMWLSLEIGPLQVKLVQLSPGMFPLASAPHFPDRNWGSKVELLTTGCTGEVHPCTLSVVVPPPTVWNLAPAWNRPLDVWGDLRLPLGNFAARAEKWRQHHNRLRGC